MVTVLLPDIRGWTYAQRQECGSAGPWLSLVLLSSVSIILPRIGLSWGFIASLAPSMDLFTQGLLKGHFWPLVSFFQMPLVFFFFSDVLPWLDPGVESLAGSCYMDFSLCCVSRLLSPAPSIGDRHSEHLFEFARLLPHVILPCK